MPANSFTTREWFDYESDDTETYAVLLPAWLGKDAKLGFTEWTTTNKPLPQGMKMRYAIIGHPTDGRTRKVPCGTTACDMFTNAGETILIKERNDVTGTSWVKKSKKPEMPAREATNLHSYA